MATWIWIGFDCARCSNNGMVRMTAGQYLCLACFRVFDVLSGVIYAEGYEIALRSIGVAVDIDVSAEKLRVISEDEYEVLCGSLNTRIR